MLKLLKIVRETGDVTVKYPAKPIDLPQGFRGRPDYKPQQCIVCAACTTACPANALTMETDLKKGTRTWQLFIGRCIFCGRCEEVCPTHAIVLSNDFELSVANKADLYQRGTFKVANCRVCGKPFAPQKEIDYVMDLLEQAGEEGVQERREQFETCPHCKRMQNIDDKSNVTLSKYLKTENAK